MNHPFQTRPYLSFISIAVLVLLFYKVQHVPKHYMFFNCKNPCYYDVTGDALPAAENLSLPANTRSIFFHETSCRGGLTVRQACSVESAARAHPQWQIYVLFSAPVTDHALKTTCLAKLLQFPNVRFLRLHITEYSKGMEVHSVLLQSVQKSAFPIQHLADILRIVTLNKWGGLYLDTDMIVARSLEQLPVNFIAKESYLDIATGIMAFAKDEIGSNVTNAIMKRISKTYLPQYWLANGPEAITKVVEEMCPEVVHSPSYATKPIFDCRGFFIYDFDLFYPMYYSELDDIFGDIPNYFDVERPFTYHMWDFLTRNKTIHENTVYEIVARRFCPTIYNSYREEFVSKLNRSTSPHNQ